MWGFYLTRPKEGRSAIEIDHAEALEAGRHFLELSKGMAAFGLGVFLMGAPILMWVDSFNTAMGSDAEMLELAIRRLGPSVPATVSGQRFLAIAVLLGLTVSFFVGAYLAAVGRKLLDRERDRMLKVDDKKVMRRLDEDLLSSLGER